MSLAFFCPKWVKQDQKVTILKDDVYKKGHLNINNNGHWEFVTYDAHDRISYKSSLSDLQYTWKIKMKRIILIWDGILKRLTEYMVLVVMFQQLIYTQILLSQTYHQLVIILITKYGI